MQRLNRNCGRLLHSQHNSITGSCAQLARQPFAQKYFSVPRRLLAWHMVKSPESFINSVDLNTRRYSLAWLMRNSSFERNKRASPSKTSSGKLRIALYVIGQLVAKERA